MRVFPMACIFLGFSKIVFLRIFWNLCKTMFTKIGAKYFLSKISLESQKPWNENFVKRKNLKNRKTLFANVSERCASFGTRNPIWPFLEGPPSKKWPIFCQYFFRNFFLMFWNVFTHFFHQNRIYSIFSSTFFHIFFLHQGSFAPYVTRFNGGFAAHNPPPGTPSQGPGARMLWDWNSSDRFWDITS